MKLNNATHTLKSNTQMVLKNMQINGTSKISQHSLVRQFGQPAEIHISNSGRDMQKQRLLDQLEGKHLGEAAKKIYDMDAEEQERQNKLETIDELEKKLAETEGLTSADKEMLQKDIDRLKDGTETDEDKLKKLSELKLNLQEKLETASPDAAIGISHKLEYYNQQISAIEAKQEKKSAERAALNLDLIKENAKKDTEQINEKQLVNGINNVETSPILDSLLNDTPVPIVKNLYTKSDQPKDNFNTNVTNDDE